MQRIVSRSSLITVKASMRDEIKELTEQLAGLRSELEKLRSN
jgi:sensor histidine kinase regulating citrate/malate metabolism